MGATTTDIKAKVIYEYFHYVDYKIYIEIVIIIYFF